MLHPGILEKAMKIFSVRKGDLEDDITNQGIGLWIGGLITS
jgi:hypothetical protein